MDEQLGELELGAVMAQQHYAGAAPDDVSAELAEQVASHPAGLGGTTRLVCIDGPAGSGKTTLAAKLGALLPAQVIHMDDLFEGWGGLEAGVRRLHEWILTPLAAGRSGRYRRYDWGLGTYAERHSVPCADFLVVEGCGSASLEVDRFDPFIIWVEADEEERLARGLARDGEHLESEWHRFMAQERKHFGYNRTAQRADVHLDGHGAFVP